MPKASDAAVVLAWREPFTRLLDRPGEFIRRRVEKLELLTTSRLRRRVTIDLVVPDDLVTDPDGLTRWIPVAVISKKGSTGPRDFTVEGASGERLPLLASQENRRIPQAEMQALARECGLQDSFKAKHLRLALGRSPRSLGHRAAVAHLESALENAPLAVRRSPEWKRLRMLLGIFATHFVLAIGVPAGGPRRVLVKYSFSDPYWFPWTRIGRSRWRRVADWARRLVSLATWDALIATPGVGMCSSYHVEMEVPPDLEATRATLLAFDGRTWIAVDDPRPGRQIHVHTSRAASFNNRDSRLLVSLHPVHRRWQYLAIGGAIATALSLLMGLIFARQWANGRDFVVFAEPIVALLVAIPAAVLNALMGRSPHDVTSRVLRPLRLFGFVTLLTAFFASWTVLLVQEPVDVYRYISRLLVISVALALLYLVAVTVNWRDSVFSRVHGAIDLERGTFI